MGRQRQIPAFAALQESSRVTSSEAETSSCGEHHSDNEFVEKRVKKRSFRQRLRKRAGSEPPQVRQPTQLRRVSSRDDASRDATPEPDAERMTEGDYAIPQDALERLRQRQRSEDSGCESCESTDSRKGGKFKRAVSKLLNWHKSAPSSLSTTPTGSYDHLPGLNSGTGSSNGSVFSRPSDSPLPSLPALREPSDDVKRHSYAAVDTESEDDEPMPAPRRRHSLTRVRLRAKPTKKAAQSAASSAASSAAASAATSPTSTLQSDSFAFSVEPPAKPERRLSRRKQKQLEKKQLKEEKKRQKLLEEQEAERQRAEAQRQREAAVAAAAAAAAAEQQHRELQQEEEEEQFDQDLDFLSQPAPTPDLLEVDPAPEEPAPEPEAPDDELTALPVMRTGVDRGRGVNRQSTRDLLSVALMDVIQFRGQGVEGKQALDLLQVAIGTGRDALQSLPDCPQLEMLEAAVCQLISEQSGASDDQLDVFRRTLNVVQAVDDEHDNFPDCPDFATYIPVSDRISQQAEQKIYDTSDEVFGF